jgi:hypothetical protein
LSFDQIVAAPPEAEMFPFTEASLCNACRCFGIQKLVSINGYLYLKNKIDPEASAEQKCMLCASLAGTPLKHHSFAASEARQSSLHLAGSESFPGLLNSDLVVAKQGIDVPSYIFGIYTDRGR